MSSGGEKFSATNDGYDDESIEAVEGIFQNEGQGPRPEAVVMNGENTEGVVTMEEYLPSSLTESGRQFDDFREEDEDRSSGSGHSSNVS